MAIVTLNDYTTYPTSRPHPFTRQCPNMHTCWPSLWETYNPLAADQPIALRRLRFLIIQLLQLIHLLVFRLYFSLSLAALPWTLLHILFFFFVAWNLHLIVKMEGERLVFGRSFGRGAFDGFLTALVVVYGVLVVGDVVGLGAAGGYVIELVWVLCSLAIFGVAWVSTWEAQGVNLA